MTQPVEQRIKEGKPDFIIVGAMKAGTSTLVQQLRSHPEIGVAHREAHYFSRPKFDERDLAWYVERLLSGFDNQISIIGEKSACYSHSKTAAARIRAEAPNTKILWMLRNPVDRTYSHYLHFAKRGRERRSFAEVIADPRNTYVRRSDYVVQVKRFLKHFPLEQMHFTLLDDMQDEETDHLKPVLEFLGVEQTGFVPVVKRANRTVVAYQPFMRLAAKILGPKSHAFGRIERILRTRSSAGYEPMDPDTRKALVARFRSQNAKLGRIIHRDLSAWNR